MYAVILREPDGEPVHQRIAIAGVQWPVLWQNSRRKPKRPTLLPQTRLTRHPLEDLDVVGSHCSIHIGSRFPLTLTTRGCNVPCPQRERSANLAIKSIS